MKKSRHYCSNKIVLHHLKMVFPPICLEETIPYSLLSRHYCIGGQARHIRHYYLGALHYYMAPMAPRFSARGGSASLFGGS
ncbi:MAG: hypothetical protein L6420_05110, partial [Elusimicrobia bacterium]|nr:hypothetical protein [Elusimicrobiota bacterium]